MTEFTRPATWQDVARVARYLNEAGVEYALIGGYAIAAHGFNRFSEDIDLLVNPSANNTARWILALSRLPDGAARELAGEPNVFAHEHRYAIRINDEITVDVMPSAGGVSWDELRQHIVEHQVAGERIPLLDMQGLLKTKQGSRPKDQLDAAVLRGALDALRGR
jgi:hypothetical protein